MKDTNGNPITEEEFMKDIGHGVERTQENWKEEFELLFEKNTEIDIHNVVSGLTCDRSTRHIFIAFISKLLAEKRNKVLSEVEREVEKKQYYSDDGQQYVTSIEDISTIINNMKVK